MSRAPRILVADDEPGICRLLKSLLSEAGYQVKVFERPVEAIKAIRDEDFDLLVSDVKMPKAGGLDLLRAVRDKSADIPVILITAYSSVDAAVAAMREGATDYVTKPFKNDEMLLVVSRALETRRLKDENVRLKEELASRYAFDRLQGRSAAMQKTFALMRQVAPSDTTVLIQGESGTGKELAARAIHHHSPRKEGPFVAIHCGAIPESLLESELFGHVRGAFTDALKDRTGLLESAEGGTIFLDEIGDMPAALQVKLLRFLQEREIRPVGGLETRKVDVRVIAASHKNLEGEIAAGRFREDLFYRIAVVILTLPPLRQRTEDIELLASQFLKVYSEKAGKTINSFRSDTMKALEQYRWPGNVRELENAVEHAVAMSTGPEILSEGLPSSIFTDLRAERPIVESVASAQSFRDAKLASSDEFERRFLAELMKKAGNNISKAASLAQMDRKHLQELLHKHHLHPKTVTQ